MSSSEPIRVVLGMPTVGKTEFLKSVNGVDIDDVQEAALLSADGWVLCKAYDKYHSDRSKEEAEFINRFSEALCRLITDDTKYICLWSSTQLFIVETVLTILGRDFTIECYVRQPLVAVNEWNKRVRSSGKGKRLEVPGGMSGFSQSFTEYCDVSSRRGLKFTILGEGEYLNQVLKS